MAGSSADSWEAARRAAREARQRADAASSARPVGDTDAALDAALADASLDARARPPTDALLSGAHAVLDAEAETIWYRADAAPPLRRLFLAHELGHFHLHHAHGPEGGCACDEADLDEDPVLASVGYGPRQRRETEANVWAREFLLPVPLARRLFYDDGLSASRIADRLGLPLSAVHAQLGEALTPVHTLTSLSPLSGKPSPPAPLPAAGRGVPVADSADASRQSTADSIAGIPPPEMREGKGLGAPLDPSQQAAAYAEAGPLLVGAGPGTGKTRTLTERVLFLVRERGVSPENLLALTFSRKATEEMRERIAAQDPEIARRAAISTFHAYGLDLLRRHWRAADLPPRPVLLDAVDALTLLERRLADIPLGPLRYLHDPSYPLPDVLRAIARAKEEMVTPEAFAARAEALGDEKLQDVARLYAAYESLLREKGALDFADLVCRALRLLEENPAVRAAERARWRHILVDEYQDVNRAGARLVRLLSGDSGAGLWAVGDLRQAIYAFRGASPANVARFAEDFPNGRRTDLAVNYRSVPPLVELFGMVCGESGAWSAARAPLPTTREAGGGEGAILTTAPDDSAQADDIAGRMRAFAEGGYGYGDQVVLCRTRGQARQMRAALAERSIPIAPDAAENSLLAQRDVRDLLALLSRAAEPSGPARHRFPELPDALAYGPGDASDLFLAALWGDYGLARRLTDPAAVAPLLALARGYRERAALILEETEDPRTAFLAHVRRMGRLGASFGGVASSPEGGAPDAVRVLTVHAAKGLEFPIVFVPNLSAGKFPSRPGPSLLPALPLAATEPAADEEARLFFVALTRARDYLILSRAEKYNGRSAQPSPLLAAMESAEKAGLIDDTPPPFPLPSEGEGAFRAKLPCRDDGLSSSTGTGDGSHEAPDPSEPDARQQTGPASTPHTPPRQGSFALNAPSPSEGRGKGGGVISASDAELYLRCPRRYYYEQVLELPTGERDAYRKFRRAVQTALEAPDPAGALDAAWVERGPDPAHPHTGLYRAAAEEIVTQAVARQHRESEVPLAFARREKDGPGDVPAPPILSLPLENGVVAVQPDAANAAGTVLECRTFRKVPSGEEEAGPEMRSSLLYEAAAVASGGQSVTVQMRYLQTGEARPVADKPKQRQKHLAAYDRALKGIQLQIWNPEPEDTADCPACPYFFICPD